MTTEWKLVPVEPTEEMLMAFDENCDGLDPEIAQSQWQKILAAAPVPSAGAVEVNHQYLCKGLYERWMPLQESEVEDAKREGFQVRELVDRAHVTRLTAENARLQAELKEALHTSVKEDVFDVVCKERDALKAEVERMQLQQFAWLWTHCRAIGMTEKSLSGTMEHDIAHFIITLQSELTKARELTSELRTSHKLGVVVDEKVLYRLERLLANQSAPAAKGEPRTAIQQKLIDGCKAAGFLE